MSRLRLTRISFSTRWKVRVPPPNTERDVDYIGRKHLDLGRDRPLQRHRLARREVTRAVSTIAMSTSPLATACTISAGGFGFE